MNPDRWQKVQNLYFTAIELPSSERTTFLKQTCAQDPEIQREVQSLLDSENKMGEFLQQTAIDVLVAAYGEDIADDPSAEQADRDELIGAVIAERYLVREHIGSGGMGDVYRADHRLLGTPVAIKRLAERFRSRADHRRRFVAEARRAVMLDHENIADVKDVVEKAGEVFVVMEFIDGSTLRRRLNRAFEIDEFLAIASQCAGALAAAHKERIVHLDIKPENIMLTATGKVKICDFGLACQLPAGGEEDGQSRDDWTFGGTPAYMAPEVIESHRFDDRADVFSLGVVFYEMLSGKNPFRVDDVRATTKRILADNPIGLHTLNKKLPRRLVHLVHRMLAKNPAQRIGSAEVVRELQVLQHQRQFLTDAWQLAAHNPYSVSGAVAALLFTVVGLMYFNPISVALGFYPLPAAKNIVVLPTRFEGASPENARYAAGLNEAVASDLTKLAPHPGFQVIPFSQVRTAGIRSADDARRVLSANLVLETSFNDLRDRFRIDLSLRDPSRRTTLRRDSVSIGKEHVASLQPQVVAAVLRMVQLELTETERERLHNTGTQNTDADWFYHQALGALQEYQKPENIDRSIELFTAALNADSAFAAAHAGLGQAYWRKYSDTNKPNWVDMAQNSCQRADFYDDRSAEAHLCLGTVAAGTGNFVGAENEFRKAAEYAPTSDEANRGLARTLDLQHKYDEAEKTYLHAIELRRDYWSTYSRLGTFYLAQGKLEQAVDQYETALAYSPNNPIVLNSLGIPYLRLSRYDAALKKFKQAVDERPSRESFNNMGAFLLKLRRYNEAIPYLEKAANLSDHCRDTGNLARAFWLIGQPDKARELFNLAVQKGEEQLKVNRNDSDVHLLIGAYNAYLGDKDAARAHINIALGERPPDAHYLTFAAVANTVMGNSQEALTQLEKAHARGLQNWEVQTEPELDALRGPKLEAIFR